jgi:hypothetical protein
MSGLFRFTFIRSCCGSQCCKAQVRSLQGLLPALKTNDPMVSLTDFRRSVLCFNISRMVSKQQSQEKLPIDFSRLIYHAMQGEQHLVQVKCHEKYGPSFYSTLLLDSRISGHIFRAGPNSVLIADPQFAQQYYTWDRSDWWTCFIPRPGDTATNFTRNYKEHNAKKKRVTGAVRTIFKRNDG